MCAAVIGLLCAAAGARAALVRVGAPATATADAITVRPLAAGTHLHVTVTLRPRNPVALAAYARAVSSPGSSVYRRYLSPAQFARRFGATPAGVTAVRDALRARGLTPGPLSAGGLSIPVTATAAALQRGFAVGLRRLTLPGRRTAIAAGAAPAVDASGAAAIQSVIGLDTTAEPRPLLRRALRPKPGSPRLPRHPAGGGPHACAAARAAAPGQGAYTADQIASAYGFSGLYAAGDAGAGVTVAVYELEPDDPADIAAYQACYGTHARISYVTVDQGAGRGPGSGEAALDIENLIGLAPRIDVIVYQGPDADSGQPGSGPYDTFSAIINQDRARVITVSWGECEPMLGQSSRVAENTLFAQAAAQGQSIVAASGDSGAQDCDTGGAAPDTEPAVDDPSSQPEVTAVGGTSLIALGPRPTERVWNDGAFTAGAAAAAGAGGGGVSSVWAMPPAQLDAAPSLGVRNPLAAGAACGQPAGYCREVPDVAANADPHHAYLIYFNGRGAARGQRAGWQGAGGTSGAAPVWGAVLALADASRGCIGSPVGFADPALYRAAGGAYAADFNDVTSGENDLTHTNDGRYAAATGYDPVTGLGTPNAAALVGALCGAARSGPTAPGSHRGSRRDLDGRRRRLRRRHGAPAARLATVTTSGP